MSKERLLEFLMECRKLAEHGLTKDQELRIIFALREALEKMNQPKTMVLVENPVDISSDYLPEE
jgi:hypothetical protein